MRYRFFSSLLLLASCAFGNITNGVVAASASPAPSGTFTFSSTSTIAGDLASMVFQPSTSSGAPTSDAHSCRIDYDVINNWIVLHSDAGGSYVGYGHPGQTPSYGTMGNSQCNFSLPGVTVSRSGNTVSVTVQNLIFTPAYYGVLNLWTYGNSNGQENSSGWNYYTTWTAGPVGPPSVAITNGSLNGSGAAMTVSMSVTSAAGFNDVGGMAWYASNHCGIYVNGNQVSVLNDNYGWQPGIPLGTTAGQSENGSCVFLNSSILVNGSGYTKNLVFQVLFKPGFEGTWPITIQGYSYTGGWSTAVPGNWTVQTPRTTSTFNQIGDVSPTAYDDYTGLTVQLPTSTNGRVAAAYITQPQNTGDNPLAQGTPYTVVIAGAAPNAPVWARSTSGTIPTEAVGTYDSWSPITGITIPVYGAAAVGVTDSNGYFSANWQTQHIAGATTTSFWVGGSTVADPNYPPNIASTVDETAFSGNVWFYTENSDGSVASDFSPDNVKHIRLSRGRTISIKRAPRIKVQKHATSTFDLDSSGVYTYHFSLDTSDASVQMIRVNDDPEISMGVKFSDDDGNGWYGTGEAWLAGPKAEHKTGLSFTLKSKWKPGPVEIYLHGDPTIIPMQANSAENLIVSRAVSISHDSTTEVAIGPSINPNLDEAGMRKLVRSWKDWMGFSFLAPFLEASDLKAGLDALKPTTDMERTIVDCLRNVI